MTEVFLKLMEDINSQLWEAQWTLNRINTKKTTLKHIVIKLLKSKDKEKILKAAKGKKTPQV